MQCYQRFVYALLSLLLSFVITTLPAQINQRYSSQIPGSNTQVRSKQDTTGDKLEHRDKYADSITIFYRYWDSTRTNKIDSSVTDFYTRYPVPWRYDDLGNFGTAARSLVFTPIMKPGFDAGFHAYDIYFLTPENTRFFSTTRPYSETAYLLGSKGEQMIDMFHTQNRSSNVNFGFNIRIINSPGAFKNQQTNNTSLRFNTLIQSDNKRYTNYFIFINNKINTAENGGVQNVDSLNKLALNDPFEAATKLGNEDNNTRSFFTSTVATGSVYRQSVFVMRQTYDLGQKDSLVKDSVTYKLFYPRIRFQHTLQFSQNKYSFQDIDPNPQLYANFLMYGSVKDTVAFKDEWYNLTNEFSILSYPVKNNQNQFLKVGAGYELISGRLGDYTKRYNNIYLQGEYRNRTRNQLWDVEASGKLYVAGPYTGNYSALITLRKSLKNNRGSLLAGFHNVNRTPTFLANETITSNDTFHFRSSLTTFPVIANGSFNKENITRVFAAISIPPLQLNLSGDYYLLTNYTYFNNLYNVSQSSSIFNLLHLGAEKKVHVFKHVNWYIEGDVQKTAGNAPVSVPLVLGRSRFAFEGNFFKNLDLSTGIEIRYYTPYKPYGYSPLNGQFYYQEEEMITNRPDVNLFFHFRIKSFKGFIRLEQLNTINPEDGYNFNHYNFTAPGYPNKALWFRIGIWWNFVN